MKNNITVTFFSNFLLHHQTPFCEAMIREIGEGFKFVATEPIPEERLKMGYYNYTGIPYVVYSYKNEEEYQKALKLGYESDVVIIGSAPDIFIEERLKENKLTFRYCERYFKEGRWRLLDPRVLRARYKADFRYRNKNLYMLCASAYTAPDCRFIFSYPQKTYKWGYFPEVKEYSDVYEIIKGKKKSSILWVGRFLNWKHPEMAVSVAKQLKDNGYKFELNIIGGGALEKHLRQSIKQNCLNDKVHLLGTMSPENVREQMEKADIFLFTSDRNEGWGAVLNESLNSACAVVANREIGSVPYLIKDGENGLIYDRNIKDDLYKKVKMLLENIEMKQAIQKNAYETMRNMWNADVAAHRLLELINNLKEGKATPFKDGPCSKD